jgi:ABC-type branched-subunit amino acid transport system substrate-binding protein
VQFGVTHHLIGNYVRHDDGRAGAPDVKAPWYSLEHTFVMEAARRGCRGRRSRARRKASGRKFRISSRSNSAAVTKTKMWEENVDVAQNGTQGHGRDRRGRPVGPSAARTRTLKIGCSLPLTGAGFTAVGRELTGALKVYMQQHGDTVAGRKIELIIRDDAGVGDNARRSSRK